MFWFVLWFIDNLDCLLSRLSSVVGTDVAVHCNAENDGKADKSNVQFSLTQHCIELCEVLHHGRV
jgi:hypothetical protein